MPESSTRLVETIALLARHGVRCIVIGGVAAVVQGAPLLTLDVDVVPAMDDENRVRLLASLRELEACYREQMQRRIELELRPGLRVTVLEERDRGGAKPV